MNEEVMNKATTYEMQKKLVISLLKSTMFKTAILLIDALIIWIVYAAVLVPRFNIPVLSKWEVLAILFAYRFSMKGQ